MSSRRLLVYGFALLLSGCTTAPAPKPQVEPVAPPVVQAPLPSNTEVTPQLVALVEPYLVLAEPEKIFVAPPSLGGRIRMSEPVPESGPLIAPAPSEIRPVPSEPKVTPNPSPGPVQAKPAPSPRSNMTTVTTMVRLLEEERARSVEVAKARLAAATARASQTAAEAKKTVELVRAGALAQFKADQAAAAAKEAVSEQTEAQKALDEAQQRQREARRDVEAALRGMAEVDGMVLVAEKVKVPSYQPLPFTYRLSILGSDTTETPKVQGGTLGRALPTNSGEAGAWIVRCADPKRLRVTVGSQTVTIVPRKLPSAAVEKPRV